MELVAIQVLPYLTTVIGFLIVWVLNGIKSEIKEIKTTIEGLRDEMVDLDHRVVRIEAGCSYMHGERKVNV